MAADDRDIPSLRNEIRVLREMLAWLYQCRALDHDVMAAEPVDDRMEPVIDFANDKIETLRTKITRRAIANSEDASTSPEALAQSVRAGREDHGGDPEKEGPK